MDKEQLENIFKRFYRLDSAHTRDGSYGLGLPIAEGIVKEHHGKIWAEAENGVTSFHVRMKLA
ncbi:MAG: ATP-binding protein [Oscillospiraceae bacterium]|nr:ATP-binding protein [Oscillospiraceae bacterium]